MSKPLLIWFLRFAFPTIRAACHGVLSDDGIAVFLWIALLQGHSSCSTLRKNDADFEKHRAGSIYTGGAEPRARPESLSLPCEAATTVLSIGISQGAGFISHQDFKKLGINQCCFLETTRHRGWGKTRVLEVK